MTADVPSPADDLTAELERLHAIGTATEHPEGTCWLCHGLGGIAIHLKWSAERGEGKLPLWTAHEYPSDDPHPVEPCPACALFFSAAAVEAVLKEADDFEANRPERLVPRSYAAECFRAAVIRTFAGGTDG